MGRPRRTTVALTTALAVAGLGTVGCTGAGPEPPPFLNGDATAIEAGAADQPTVSAAGFTDLRGRADVAWYGIDDPAFAATQWRPPGGGLCVRLVDRRSADGRASEVCADDPPPDLTLVVRLDDVVAVGNLDGSGATWAADPSGDRYQELVGPVAILPVGDGVDGRLRFYDADGVEVRPPMTGNVSMSS